MALVITASVSAVRADDEFPGRKLYPDVPVMSTGELKQKFKSVVVVDARTKYEFDTIVTSRAPRISSSQKIVSLTR